MVAFPHYPDRWRDLYGLKRWLILSLFLACPGKKKSSAFQRNKNNSWPEERSSASPFPRPSEAAASGRKLVGAPISVYFLASTGPSHFLIWKRRRGIERKCGGEQRLAQHQGRGGTHLRSQEALGWPCCCHHDVGFTWLFESQLLLPFTAKRWLLYR